MRQCRISLPSLGIFAIPLNIFANPLTIFVESDNITTSIAKSTKSMAIFATRKARSAYEETAMHRMITRDPVSGGELIVTRLECPESGIVIEGQFSLGWLGRLSTEQLDFVEALIRSRGNVQKAAAELDMAYNTARARLDELATALGGAPEGDSRPDRRQVLDRLASKEISVEEAMRMLKG
jgi:hypothetical protein